MEEDEDEILRQKVLNCVPVKRTNRINESQSIKINIKIDNLTMNSNNILISNDSVKLKCLKTYDSDKIDWKRYSHAYK